MDNKYFKFFFSKKNLYILGSIIVFILTFLEVIRRRDFNFLIFANSTRDFWSGIAPYGAEWASRHHDFFLYAPPFSVLFIPFAFVPLWLGAFLWNLFNFTMFFVAVFSLPNKYSFEQKCKTFLYLFLILATAQQAFQYNVTIAYCFLFAYSLLERDKAFLAVLIIMISGFTKIYGIFQLGLLLCYPKFWRNMGYALLFGVVLFFLPAIKLGFSGLLPYYSQWIVGLGEHRMLPRTLATVFYMKPLLYRLMPYQKYVQMATVAILAVLLLANRKKYKNFAFRASALSVLMGWMILFSDMSEKHTYVIALAGYLLWYWNRTPNRLDKILFWANFVLMCWMPVDILFPVPVMTYVCDNHFVNLWVFLFIWLRMIYTTFLQAGNISATSNNLRGASATG